MITLPSDIEESDICSKCGQGMVLRARAPAPVWTQIFFVLSFIIFMFISDRLKGHRFAAQISGVWCFLQIGLGILLVRRRTLSKQRVYRCIRCSSDLR